jgi:galactonate dehydratase
MKIRDVRVLGVRVNHRGDWLFVRLETEDGLVGLGEASHSGDDAALARLVTGTLGPSLREGDPTTIEPLWHELVRLAGGGRALGRLEATAVSGVEQALWDLNAQALGVPIHRLLGGALRDRIPLYANVNRAVTDRSSVGFAAAARQAVDEGFRAVKLAPFDGVDRTMTDPSDTRVRAGIERVRAVRDGVGPDVEVMVDCHGRFNPDMGIWVARELGPIGLFWYEEPIRFEDDPHGLAQVSASVDQPVAGGELLFGRAGFWPLIRRRAVATIMPDVKHCGGLWEGRKIAALAETAGLTVSPHNPSGPVAALASAHLASTLPNFSHLEYAWGEVPWRAALTDPLESILDGALVLPKGSGLGATLDESALAERAFDPSIQ